MAFFLGQVSQLDAQLYNLGSHGQSIGPQATDPSSIPSFYISNCRKSKKTVLLRQAEYYWSSPIGGFTTPQSCKFK